MNRGSIARRLSACLFATLIASASERLAVAQTAQPAPSPSVAEVRQMVADARDQPTSTSSAALWQVHERAPHSEAGAIAAAEAIRLLNRAGLSDRAQARVASLDSDDPAWQRVPAVLYENAIMRKSFDDTMATLSRTIAATKVASNKAAALLIIGRVHRRQGDLPAATRSLEEARAAAPGTPQAKEADGLIYEIKYLSVGLAAPAISGTPRNADRAITLDAFRGKPIVLVFWSTTCAVCMEEVPLLKTLNAKYSKDAVILGISVDVSLDRVDRTLEAQGMTWPQLADGRGFDGAIPTSYRIEGTPELFVLDRAGRIFARTGSATQVEALIKGALARPPQP